MVGNLIDELSGLLIKAKTKEAFLEHLQSGNILSNSIVFILDTHEIWTQGQYWPCPYTKDEINALFAQVSNAINQVTALYSELNGKLSEYQYSTNQLIEEKSQEATIALAAEVARASEQESKLSASVSSLSQNLATESSRAAAAEEALRTSKVDKVEGKSLVLDTEIEKLSGLNSQETINTNTKVSLEEVASTTLYKQYSIKQGGTQIGTIDIPKDQSITEGSIKVVTESDSPYAGAVIGDKYFDFISPNSPTGHVYVQANELVDTYNQGDGIKVEGKIISIKVDPSTETFLTLGSNGMKISGVQDALNTKVDKVTGKSLVSDVLITKLTNLDSQENITSNIADAKKVGTDAQLSLDSHASNTANPHKVTKDQVGLGNVDNTSDINKPISNATKTALDEINTKISWLTIE